MDDAELQSRHNALTFLQTKRTEMSTGEQMTWIKSRPETNPDFVTWLTKSLIEQKTSYTLSGEQSHWEVIRGCDQGSMDTLIIVLDLFSTKQARRPVSVANIDKLIPKLVLQGFWYGFFPSPCDI